MTAYRQSALAIARLLENKGPAKASHVARTLKQPKARDILYKDVYGWFERVSRGVYQLSPRGKQELPLWREDVADPIPEMKTTAHNILKPAANHGPGKAPR